MSETRWCLRCGREKALTEFRPDASRAKRLVVNHCHECEIRTGAVPSTFGTTACRYCGHWFIRIRKLHAFCSTEHGQAWHREKRKEGAA